MTSIPIDSAPLDRRAEDVSVVPIVVSELELVDVERKIFLADFMERTDYSALDDRPEPFDGVRMDRTADILIAAMVNHAKREVFMERLVTLPLIGTNQADLVGHSGANELTKSAGAGGPDHGECQEFCV